MAIKPILYNSLLVAGMMGAAAGVLTLASRNDNKLAQRVSETIQPAKSISVSGLDYDLGLARSFETFDNEHKGSRIILGEYQGPNDELMETSPWKLVGIDGPDADLIPDYFDTQELHSVPAVVRERFPTPESLYDLVNRK